MDDKLLDLFPDLAYTLLLQLSSSQGPEAVSPVLKTWRLVHTGTLPEEINLQRCSRRWGGMGCKAVGLSWTLPLRSQGPQESPPPPPRGLVVLSWWREVSGSRSYNPPSHESSTVWFSLFADALPHVISLSPLS